MPSSSRFGSSADNSFALFRLAFATAPPLDGLTLLPTLTRWFIMQKVRGQAFPNFGYSPPTACRHGISDSVSLPFTGFFSPFPCGTMRYR